MTHLLVVATNRFGVLARITAVVSSTGANIETAAAYPVADSGVSIVHMRIDADSVMAERIRRKIGRLVEVIEARTDEEQSPLSVDMGRFIPAAVRHLEQTA
jgi:acetolactate synthase small subunit